VELGATISRRGLALGICLGVIGVAYAALMLAIHPHLRPTSTAYYNDLITSLLHGRTDLVTSVTYDLSHYHGKWYLYWGPTPALFVLPFYALGGPQVSDVLYDLVAGLLGVAVFSGCVVEFLRYARLKVSTFTVLFVVLNFAFASPSFFLATGGTIWFVNQVIAVLYLLVFYYCYLKFLNTERLRYVLPAALFFNLAWIARPSLVFNGLLLLYPLALLLRENRRLLGPALAITATVTGLSLAGFGWYNIARFGNPIEFGYRYQVPNPRFAADFAANRMFALSHVPHNATYAFLHGVELQFERPYVRISPEGNSIFSVYPLTLLGCLLLDRAVYPARRRWLVGLLLAALAADLAVILLDLGTGWVQFGSRYFFDLIPGLFLLILLVVEKVSVPWRSLLLVYGTGINVVGILLYYHQLHW
jgi:hypothetical protein